MIDDAASISFTIDTDEVIRFDPNGKVYVRGELVDDNHKIYSAMIDFLQETGHLTVTEWDDAEEMSIDDL